MEDWEDLHHKFSRIKYGSSMMQEEGEREEGWQEWLRDRGLYRGDEGDASNYLRYRKFAKLNLGVAPEADQPYFLQELLPLERGLVFGDAIGLADRYPFTFKVNSMDPIRQRPIAYAKEEREWIRQYMTK